jgi:muramoyltetrapeptide carboxypeptidase
MSPIVPVGTPIAVIAPSGAYDPDKLERGLQIARAAGHVMVPFPDMLQPQRYLAAPDEKRLADLIFALTSNRFGAVWCVRGGYGLTRLMHRVPWPAIRPKPIIGFSDCTPLLEVMRRRSEVVQVHGPVLHSLSETAPKQRGQLFDLLAGEAVPALVGEAWIGGTARGRLVGGNLALLAATCGTPWQVQAEGAILCLEDVGEAPYRIDRMLQQLSSAGVFDGVAGVALGTFDKCDPPEGATWTLDDVLREAVEPLGVPVVAGLSFGHVRENTSLPLGAEATIEGGTLSWRLP